MTQWLISYRYTPCSLTANGVHRGSPADTIAIVPQSPARFVLAARKKRLALDHEAYDGTAPHQRADEIECIYSAFEIDGRAFDLIKGLKDNL